MLVKYCQLHWSCYFRGVLKRAHFSGWLQCLVKISFWANWLSFFFNFLLFLIYQFIIFKHLISYNYCYFLLDQNAVSKSLCEKWWQCSWLFYMCYIIKKNKKFVNIVVKKNRQVYKCDKGDTNKEVIVAFFKIIFYDEEHWFILFTTFIWVLINISTPTLTHQQI